jgi:DNA-nicking Smr family endonuclease
MRRLADEEKALWERVVATVRPLRRSPSPIREEPVEKTRPAASPKSRLPQQQEKAALGDRSSHKGGLDAGWDRRLARGLVRPEVAIDLHGHSLATAHDLLDRRLEEAIGAGARLVLLVTGKPPRDDRFPTARGAIRASIDAWLQSSRHAGHIAAVRNAHPRHGGAGALYLVLRRLRPDC